MTAIRNAMPADELEQLGKKGEPEKGRWSQLEQLVALLVDGQREQLYAFMLANQGKGGKKPQKPEPIRRPGVRPNKKQLTPMTEASAERLFALING